MNKSNINFSYSDYVIIVSSILAILFSWLYTILYYFDMPETIVTHFDATGQPDGYGPKASIWIPLILFTFLSIFFIYSAKKPKSLDFSNKLKTNKDELYNSKVLLYSTLLLSSILIIIVYTMIQVTLNNSISTSWVTPTLITIIIIYLIILFYYQIQSKNHKRIDTK